MHSGRERMDGVWLARVYGWGGEMAGREGGKEGAGLFLCDLSLWKAELLGRGLCD